MKLIIDGKTVELPSGGSSGLEEYDTEDGWHVRKRSDGYVEMLYEGFFSGKGIIFSNFLFCVFLPNTPFPIPLVKKYEENCTLLSSNNGANGKFPTVCIVGDNLKTGQWALTTHLTQDTLVEINFSLVVRGRWK